MLVKTAGNSQLDWCISYTALAMHKGEYDANVPNLDLLSRLLSSVGK